MESFSHISVKRSWSKLHWMQMWASQINKWPDVTGQNKTKYNMGIGRRFGRSRTFASSRVSIPLCPVTSILNKKYTNKTINAQSSHTSNTSGMIRGWPGHSRMGRGGWAVAIGCLSTCVCCCTAMYDPPTRTWPSMQHSVSKLHVLNTGLPWERVGAVNWSWSLRAVAHVKDSTHRYVRGSELKIK